MSNLVPIFLRRDGLIEMKAGHTEAGDHSYVVQHNPDHIAEVIREKRRRQLIKDANWTQWAAA